MSACHCPCSKCGDNTCQCPCWQHPDGWAGVMRRLRAVLCWLIGHDWYDTYSVTYLAGEEPDGAKCDRCGRLERVELVMTSRQ